ncbi:GntR family transcriptional regulator [Rhodococcoides kyotonense]|uniref:DNA-binding transcriptional regulator, GntR family n=1 Tax=Rhodococcoides kyotonense TaxID=398843 RepID=A0A239G1J2_9NOCA|nr:GntR family transcriptional regulator [Rhodococcus kyotonensis]SNS63029.1 DNA-binding transcriptional regulator, GntR family [Rhodococcus kyotonensis]
MARKDLREKVYISLRRDLISGAIHATERLGEERLAELYGVSRTPVREALARLQADGLVMRGDDGLYPYRPHVGDLADLYELRNTLELQGIARVTGQIPHDADALEPVVEHWKQMRSTPPEPDADFVTQDEMFHVALLRSAGNHALADALQTVNARIRPVRMFGYFTPDSVVATIDEHVVIGEFVLAGDLDGARQALLSHIDNSQQVVITRATEALSMARFALSVQN